MEYIKYVGLPAIDVIERLNARNVKFQMKYTVPIKGYFKVNPDMLYIIRARELENGILELTAAAKMRKEVLRNGL